MSNSTPIRVWDLPVRVFHWLVVACVATSYLAYNLGAMELHEKSGILILALVTTRILWGFAGSTSARFASFLREPAAVKGYVAALRRGETPRPAGHNPLGGWAVLALLGALLVQGTLGLFSHEEDGDFQGPLMHLVGEKLSETFTLVHESFWSVLMVVVGVHIAANLWYLKRRGENLVRPMVTGVKDAADLDDPDAARDLRFRNPLLALVLFSAVLVGLLALLGEL